MKSRRNHTISVDRLLLPETGAVGVRRALSKLDEFDFTGPHSGLLMLDSQMADVRIEPNDTIRVAIFTEFPAGDGAALTLNGNLSGNARFAMNRHNRGQLIADTQVNGETHLRNTFRNIASAFGQAIDEKIAATEPLDASPAIGRDQIRAVVAGLSWDAQAVVEQDEKWELRPRIAGQVWPVCLFGEADRAEVRVERIVLESLPTGRAAVMAVRDQALRFNAQFRFARLAERSGKLVCESCLHAGQIQPVWLSTVIHAVATACCHVQTLLRVLAEQRDVAESYVSTFCSAGEQVAPAGATN